MGKELYYLFKSICGLNFTLVCNRKIYLNEDIIQENQRRKRFKFNVFGQTCRKPSLTAVGIRCAGHVTPFIRKRLALTSPTCGGRSVGVVRLRTKSHGVCLFVWTDL
jgi:hypothetical protein